MRAPRGGAGAREARKAAPGRQATGPNGDMKAPADTGTLLPPGPTATLGPADRASNEEYQTTDHLVLHASTEGRRDSPDEHVIGGRCIKIRVLAYLPSCTPDRWLCGWRLITVHSPAAMCVLTAGLYGRRGTPERTFCRAAAPCGCLSSLACWPAYRRRGASQWIWPGRVVASRRCEPRGLSCSSSGAGPAGSPRRWPGALECG
jgi:hypothetical protein